MIGTSTIAFDTPFSRFYELDTGWSTSTESNIYYDLGDLRFDPSRDIPPTEEELFLAHRRRLAELRGTFVPIAPRPASPAPILVMGRGATRSRKGGRS